MDEPEKHIAFELPVKLNHTSFIDGYIESTRVLIAPLFLDGLKTEFAEIEAVTAERTRKIGGIQRKLAGLKFLEIPLLKLIQNKAA